MREHDTRFVTCTQCEGFGRIYGGHPNNPDPSDYGTCPACKGSGEAEQELLPVTEEDIMSGEMERADASDIERRDFYRGTNIGAVQSMRGTVKPVSVGLYSDYRGKRGSYTSQTIWLALDDARELIDALTKAVEHVEARDRADRERVSA